MGTLALIGLGSNLGDRKATLDAAVASLSEAPGVTLRGVSSYHETAPVGGPGGQGAFLNAAAALETTREPVALLHLLHDLERRAGRFREVRWSARTLDLDLLLFSEAILETPELTVPHPRMAVRRFVLAPLAEVAPEAIDPRTGRTVADLRANLDRRPSYVALDLPRSLSSPVFRLLSRDLGVIGLTDPAEPPPALSGPIPGFAETEPLGRLVQRARELSADRWTTERWGDRWVATDFWFDRLGQDLLDRPGAPRPDEIRAWLSRARSVILHPTFVVSDRRIGATVPMLPVSGDRAEVIATEAIAACRSSRPA